MVRRQTAKRVQDAEREAARVRDDENLVSEWLARQAEDEKRAIDAEARQRIAAVFGSRAPTKQAVRSFVYVVARERMESEVAA